MPHSADMAAAWEAVAVVRMAWRRRLLALALGMGVCRHLAALPQPVAMEPALELVEAAVALALAEAAILPRELAEAAAPRQALDTSPLQWLPLWRTPVGPGS